MTTVVHPATVRAFADVLWGRASRLAAALQATEDQGGRTTWTGPSRRALDTAALGRVPAIEDAVRALTTAARDLDGLADELDSEWATLAADRVAVLAHLRETGVSAQVRRVRVQEGDLPEVGDPAWAQLAAQLRAAP